MVELFVFVVSAIVCLGGAVGVIVNRNPVHAALSLVATLFGIAVLFVAQEANFLAAVQVIVYAGAIVVLFLFVLMLLGVDQAEDLSVEPIPYQRIAAAVVGLLVLALPILALSSTDWEATGARPADDDRNAILVPDPEQAAAGEEEPDRVRGRADIEQLGESLFTRYLFAFEVTSALLVIAVVGAVVMSRRVRRDQEVEDPLTTARRGDDEPEPEPEPDSETSGAPT